ncbi:MAG: Trm112 family protein [Acidimicrobiia bacterium]
MGLLDPLLSSILVCTIDKSELTEDLVNRLLICTRCGRKYPVDQDGIPDMVVEDEDASGAQE